MMILFLGDPPLCHKPITYKRRKERRPAVWAVVYRSISVMPQSIGNNHLVVLNPVHKGLVCNRWEWKSWFGWSKSFDIGWSSSLWNVKGRDVLRFTWGDVLLKENWIVALTVTGLICIFRCSSLQERSVRILKVEWWMSWWTFVCYSSFSTMTSPWRTLLLWRSMCRNSWGNTERQANKSHNEESHTFHILS